MTEMQKEAEEKVNEAKAWTVATRLKEEKEEEKDRELNPEKYGKRSETRKLFKRKGNQEGGKNSKLHVLHSWVAPIINLCGDVPTSESWSHDVRCLCVMSIGTPVAGNGVWSGNGVWQSNC